MFEVVHTLTDWYDGERKGIADYCGQPHLFESEWRDRENMDADTFLLSPIDAETFSLALESWAIWRRWETAFHQGEVSAESHPALLEDRMRHEELESLLEGRLKVNPSQLLRKNADFQVRNDPNWSGYGFRPLEVQWREPS